MEHSYTIATYMGLNAIATDSNTLYLYILAANQNLYVSQLASVLAYMLYDNYSIWLSIGANTITYGALVSI